MRNSDVSHSFSMYFWTKPVCNCSYRSYLTTIVLIASRVFQLCCHEKIGAIVRIRCPTPYQFTLGLKQDKYFFVRLELRTIKERLAKCGAPLDRTKFIKNLDSIKVISDLVSDFAHLDVLRDSANSEFHKPLVPRDCVYIEARHSQYIPLIRKTLDTLAVDDLKYWVVCEDGSLTELMLD
jgi:hypothetical protein